MVNKERGLGAVGSPCTGVGGEVTIHGCRGVGSPCMGAGGGQRGNRVGCVSGVDAVCRPVIKGVV